MAKRESKTQIFRGRTFTEAVTKAKHDLGKDIVVVNRRDVRQKNLFNRLSAGKLGGETLEVELEVTLAGGEAEERDAAAGAAGHPLLRRAYAKALEGREKHSQEARLAMAAVSAAHLDVGEASTGLANRLDRIQKGLDDNRRENSGRLDEILGIISLGARGGLPAVSPELIRRYRDLVERGIEEPLAREIAEEVQRESSRDAEGDAAWLDERILRAVARRIPEAAPIASRRDGPTVAAMIGSSGVGKSTSVAKLAIRLGVKGKRSVGIVNEDMRRPGAEGQMNNLGRIFGLPVATASGPDEMRDAVGSMTGCDLILVDTAGRSPRDEAGIGQLAKILRAAGADEIHLLLSSLSSERTLLESAARFRPAGFNRVVFTKLDECFRHGGILNAASRLSEGLSYVTTGPEYASPIRPAESAWLADLILGRADVAAEAAAPRGEGGGEGPA
ncbi:MAG: hypothetical protein LBV15_01805 [Planctomycetota bacterium]|jgi:flagellar biosynthesis protein FlhF|nr:hypothetical protein [Planctomycetota bacterium]